jgi:hypothetical protein
MRKELIAERLRAFRRVVADMDIIETFGIAALERAGHSDHLLNSLLERITKEIAYPLPTPTVTALSQRYFCIVSELNLLCVPLAEGEFLLHLPDLYHELAHPLLLVSDDPLIEPFQKAHVEAVGVAFDHLQKEMEKEDGRRGPQQTRYLLDRWQVSWMKSWITEFFCDLFAVYMIGPAFVWSHMHLFIKRGGNPFTAPMHVTSHPADDARMTVMLKGLALTGHQDAAQQISTRWSALLTESGLHAEPEFRRCYPDRVLSEVARLGETGVRGLRCRIATPNTRDPVHVLLNDAWSEFWRSPSSYSTWEKRAVASLQAQDWAQRLDGQA